MSNRSIILTDELYDYLLGASLREHDLLRQLREETASHPLAVMQISPEQGQFMALLARLMDARRTLEIGVFTGYSALAVALALPPEGRIIACDISEEYTAVARRYWREAGIADKIDLRLGPAVDTLDGLIADGQAESFDMAFIDADKKEYDAYYERALVLVRQGGLIAIDNVLWSGSVIDTTDTDEEVVSIRALNAKLRDDERIHLSMLPLSDGLTLAMKR